MDVFFFILDCVLFHPWLCSFLSFTVLYFILYCVIFHSWLCFFYILDCVLFHPLLCYFSPLTVFFFVIDCVIFHLNFYIWNNNSCKNKRHAFEVTRLCCEVMNISISALRSKLWHCVDISEKQVQPIYLVEWFWFTYKRSIVMFCIPNPYFHICRGVCVILQCHVYIIGETRLRTGSVQVCSLFT